jgi:hypothetical protein
MYGDFTQRPFLSDPAAADPNLAGVLHQQGRVFIDTDGNAQTGIVNRWQDTAARDTFGAGVAAVPADAPLSFRIDTAVPGAAPGEVDLKLQPGRCWADGMLVHLTGPAPIARRATYVVPPVAPLPMPLAAPAGARDAVLLDVWRESLSAFQQPDALVEPALGGPDTTGRVLTSCALRLLRLADGDTCTNLGDKIDDHFANKGRLNVTLQPVVAVGGDCPLVDSGGYVGFEHNLYRVEVAQLPGGTPVHVKWSAFNGGLVGRGLIDPLRPGFIQLTANLQPILTSGLTDFYLETRTYSAVDGYWRTTYGARVTLNNANELVLPVVASFGAVPAAGDQFFFRLWNGLRPITDFPPGAAKPLVDGIRLEFDPDAPGRYTPEDYWTFTVRADGVANALVPGLPVPTLLDNALPDGVHHRRACLGIITWNAGAAAPAIEDCRNVFPPLTRTKSCCTWRVGDGIHSFGDFNLIQDAVDALPPEGGEICLLPGVFAENVRIVNKRHIRMHGCGARSRVVGAAPARGPDPAVILIEDSLDITLEMFAVEATDGSTGIRLAGINADMLPAGGAVPRLRQIALRALRISAADRCAIEGIGGQFILVHDCGVNMRDVRGFSPAVFLAGDDMEIARNQIRVRSGRQLDEGPTLALPLGTGRGGLQVGGTSERVRIIDNWIEGGRGNGITLGSVIVETAQRPPLHWPGWIIDFDDPCNPCRPGTSHQPPAKPGAPGRVRSAGALYDIRIERNRIFDMGMNGIGVVAFFDLGAVDEMISVVRLDILGNEIRRCLQRDVAPIDDSMLEAMGYGAIQLADVTDCVIRENTLVDNGRTHLPPVCGIYLLHAEGLDVSANCIVNNGARSGESEERGQPGARAAIFVHFAIAPTIAAPLDLLKARAPLQNGVPAVKVHDNIASQPLGHALYLVALGPVSVQGNQFTSHGNLAASKPLSLTFLAATVFILDLGLSNEDYLQFLAFAFVSGPKPAVAGPDVFQSQPGLDDLRPGWILAGGNVTFNDNQVVLDLQSAGDSRALTSITILTLDDVAFEDNQCDCSLLRDFVFVQATILGASVRVIGNRFKEGRFNAFFSAFTLGQPLNCTAQNQATHCIVARTTYLPFLVFNDNRMLWGPLGISPNVGDDGCQRYFMNPRQ